MKSAIYARVQLHNPANPASTGAPGVQERVTWVTYWVATQFLRALQLFPCALQLLSCQPGGASRAHLAVKGGCPGCPGCRYSCYSRQPLEVFLQRGRIEALAWYMQLTADQ